MNPHGAAVGSSPPGVRVDRPTMTSQGHDHAHPHTAHPNAAHSDAWLNGDLPLSQADQDRYMFTNRARNRANTRESRGIATRPGPKLGDALAIAGQRAITPARLGMNAFFEFAAGALRASLAQRPIVVVDIGCGSGTALDAFVRHGYQGTYIGLDIARSRKWNDGPHGRFERRLVLGDIHEIDLAAALAGRSIDLLISSTALEHFQDDQAALARVRAHLASQGGEAHYVPGEAALDLYGPHGFRQYSPKCLRDRFPAGEIYRYGGAGSNLLHRAVITRETRGQSSWRQRFTRAYDVARSCAVELDRWTGNSPAAAYGVLVAPRLSAMATPRQSAAA